MTMPPPFPFTAEAVAAVLDWWRLAGVDCALLDAPQRWEKAPPEPGRGRPQAPALQGRIAPPPPPAATRAPSLLDHGPLPADLDGFARWWCNPALPLPGGPAPRLAPRGPCGAALMVLVPMPEAVDRETLLSGPQGTLVAGIARALGLGEGQLHVGSALPAHCPLPGWDTLAAMGLGTVLRHHISLVRPARLLVLGGELTPLLENPPEAGAPASAFPPMLTTLAPESLLARPRQLARLWQRLLDWTMP